MFITKYFGTDVIHAVMPLRVMKIRRHTQSTVSIAVVFMTQGTFISVQNILDLDWIITIYYKSAARTHSVSNFLCLDWIVLTNIKHRREITVVKYPGLIWIVLTNDNTAARKQSIIKHPCY